ncbi:MAG: hypothetical protein AAGI51_04320 [Pseudomonadota bacterium]
MKNIASAAFSKDRDLIDVLKALFFCCFRSASVAFSEATPCQPGFAIVISALVVAPRRSSPHRRLTCCAAPYDLC